MSRKTFLWTLAVILVVLITLMLIFNRHQSSPGFVTQQDAIDFYKKSKKCLGVDILLNGAAMAADAPGISLCIGFLK